MYVSGFHVLSLKPIYFMFTDCEAGEIIHLVASVHLPVHQSVWVCRTYVVHNFNCCLDGFVEHIILIGKISNACAFVISSEKSIYTSCQRLITLLKFYSFWNFGLFFFLKHFSFCVRKPGNFFFHKTILFALEPVSYHAIHCTYLVSFFIRARLKITVLSYSV